LVYLSDALDQNLNGDEAAAFGAVFHAADLHPSFRVRKISLTDVASLPIGMRFTDLQPVEGEDVKGTSWVALFRPSLPCDRPPQYLLCLATGLSKRVGVFSSSTALGKKISVSFPHDKDMLSTAFYDSQQHLPQSTSASLGSYQVTGLSKLVADQAALLSASGQKPKVSLSFQLTSSGLLEFVSAEATIDESVKEPKPKPTPAPAPAPAASADAKEDSSETKSEGESQSQSVTQDEAAVAATASSSEPDFVWRNKTHRFPLTVTGGLLNADVRPLSVSEKEESKQVYAFHFLSCCAFSP
jgi:hypoxia up-regulated 1